MHKCLPRLQIALQGNDKPKYYPGPDKEERKTGQKESRQLELTG